MSRFNAEYDRVILSVSVQRRIETLLRRLEERTDQERQDVLERALNGLETVLDIQEKGYQIWYCKENEYGYQPIGNVVI